MKVFIFLIKVTLGLTLLGLLGVATLVTLPDETLLSFLTVKTQIAKSEAIVLPGGSFKERVTAVAKLYHDGYAPRILLTNDGVFSSWSRKYGRNLYNVEWAEEELLKLGVPNNAMVKLPFYGSSTMFDALATKKYMLKYGIKKIIIVTSDKHSRRSFWTFRHVLKDYSAEVAMVPAKSIETDRKSIKEEYYKFAYYLYRYGLQGRIPEAEEIKLEQP